MDADAARRRDRGPRARVRLVARGGSGVARVARARDTLRGDSQDVPGGVREDAESDIGVGGVVAGRNYRFGFKAAGTADTLVDLGEKLDVDVSIVDLLPADVEEDFDCPGGVHAAGVEHARPRVPRRRRRRAVRRAPGPAAPARDVRRRRRRGRVVRRRRHGDRVRARFREESVPRAGRLRGQGGDERDRSLGIAGPEGDRPTAVPRARTRRTGQRRASDARMTVERRGRRLGLWRRGGAAGVIRRRRRRGGGSGWCAWTSSRGA